MLNTNLMVRPEGDQEAQSQWGWLTEKLEKIRQSEKVVSSNDRFSISNMDNH